MRQVVKSLSTAAILLALLVTPAAAGPDRFDNPTSTVFINEIHYDNAGTDAGEAVEIAGPAGTDLTGWTVVLYNGSNGAVYDSDPLSGVIADQGGGYGTVALTYPSNGIQNGAPDGIALVNASSAVVQFLSYEGTFTAVGGPAAGLLSTDIGVSEAGSEPIGQSLQLTGAGPTYSDFVWNPPSSSSFGAANSGQTFVVVPTNPSGTGAATPAAVANGDITLLTVAVTPGTNPPSTGLSVTGDLSSIGGPASQPFFDDGTSGDAVAGDDVFSFQATVASGTAAGLKSLPIAIADAEARSGGTSIALTVLNAPTNPTGTGSATPGTVVAGGNTLLAVTVTPGANPASTGLAVSGDLTSIGGPASQPFFDDGTNGDAAAGDNVFSFRATVASATTGGAKSLPVAISDAEARTGSATIGLSVIPIIPIGAVQGGVGDSDNGLTHRSPFAPPSGNSAGSAVVAVQAVIYEKTLARTSSGGSQNGIFIQNTPATADGDPNTSDGIFVFMGGFSTLLRAGGGTYTPQVGDEIILSGRVSEFFNLSQLSAGLSLVQVVRSGVELDADVIAFDANPPDVLADASRYWERREGMRARIVPGSVVLNGRNVFPSTMDGEVWLAHPDSEIAGRSGYERRSFRDPHPLDNDPALFDDGNGYRIVLGSLGIKAAAGDKDALIAPAGTFDEVQNGPVGGVYFSFNKYQIQIEQQLELADGPDPAGNAPPAAFDRSQAYSMATFNVENLYDYRDDPFDGCDFTGNAGCPGVNPPFDYVPASNAAYQTRLGEIAAQIVDELHAPDLILVQEAEDQDICTGGAGGFSCGSTNNADGRPDTLQELAQAILNLGGPAYEAAYDRDGADDRGIVSAFLYRTDRAELLPASADDPVLGSAPTVDYRGAALGYNTDVQNPKVLNADLPGDVDLSTGFDGTNVFTRPAQVGLFRLWRDGVGTSVFVDVYALSNHFSSTPNARVGQRTEQAAYAAAIVDALQAANPDVFVIVGGDLNVYPRPDDPFVPGQSLYPSDQLGPLYDQGLVNLWDTLVAQVPEAAYSYVFEGQAQTLDQIFITPSIQAEFERMRAAHINSDWPSDYVGDGARGTSDHDPQVARFSLVPTLDRLEALLDYYAAIGDITGNNTVKNLLGHLEAAREAQAKGNLSEFRAQLQAFVNQVMGFSPKFITPEAAEALVTEAEELAAQG